MSSPLCRVTQVQTLVSVWHDLAPLTAVLVARGKLSAFFLSCDLKWTRFALRIVRMKPLLVYMRCCGLFSLVHRVYSCCTSQFPLSARTTRFPCPLRCVLVEAYASSSQRCDTWTHIQSACCKTSRPWCEYDLVAENGADFSSVPSDGLCPVEVDTPSLRV